MNETVPTPRQSVLRLIIESLIALLLLVVVAQNIQTPGSSLVGTDLQLVTLMTGQVYVARVDKLDSGWPVLRNVIQLARRNESEGQPAQLVLVPRIGDVHQPDHMVLNAAQILSVEPVSPGSPLMQRLQEALRKAPAPGKE